MSTLVLLTGCFDRASDPVLPDSALWEVATAASSSISGSVATSGVNGTAACAPWGSAIIPGATICTVDRTTSLTRVRITFEGIPNQSQFGKIAHASFPGWLGLVDMDAMISSGIANGTGNFANEPSPETAIFWYYEGDVGSRTLSHRDIVFDRPVHRAMLYYAACLSCRPPPRRGEPALVPPPPHLTLWGYGAANQILDSVNGPENWGQGSNSPSDPFGSFNRWDTLSVRSPNAVPDNQLTSIRINGYEEYIGIDDLYLYFVNFRPVSRPGTGYIGTEGSPVQFNGSVSFDPVDASGEPHPNGDPVTYLWDFGDPSSGPLNSSTLASPTHTYAQSGTYTATLTVTDPNGLSDQQSVVVTVNNAPPTILTAGPEATISYGQTYTLNLAFSDVAGAADAPFSYTVDWKSGAPTTGTVAAAAYGQPITLQKVYSVPGIYLVDVLVSDKDGGESTRIVRVEVTNFAPTAVISAPNSADAGASISFNGSGSIDPEGATLTYSWDFGDGNTSTSANPSHTYTAFGTFTVKLKVTDPHGLSNEATKPIVIQNVAPTATFANSGPANEGSTFTLSLTNPVDPTDNVFTYQFHCGGAGSDWTAWSSAHTVTCPAGEHGTKTVMGRIRDPHGASSEYTATVVVNNVSPSVSIQPLSTLTEQAQFTLNGSFTDPGIGDGPWLVSIAWGHAGATSTSTVTTWANPMAFSATHTYAAAGNFTITVTVTERSGAGASGTASLPVVVQPNNRPPTVAIGGPYSGSEGSAVTFAWSGSDPDGDVLTYSYDFGDGTSSNGFVSSLPGSHVYADNGTYSLSLSVRDPSGATAVAQTTVVIANVAPTATFNAPATVNEGSAFSLSLSNVADVSPVDTQAGFSYAFNCGSGFSSFTATASTSCTTAVDNSTLAVQGRVRDKDGGVRTYSANVTVKNVAPAVTASAVTPGTLHLGADFTLSFSFQDPGVNDGPWNFSINWGDGSAPTLGTAMPGTTVTRTHFFQSGGSFPVQVRVTDKDGGVGTSNTVTATIQPLSGLLEVQPQSIRLNDVGNGNLTAQVSSTSIGGIDVTRIDPASVRLFDPATMPANATLTFGTPVVLRNNGTHQANLSTQGGTRALLDFDRDVMIQNGHLKASTVSLRIRGKLTTGQWFEADDVTIRVIP